MIELLTQALWITLVAYIVYVIATWVYKKYLKPTPDPFFYILQIKKEGDLKYKIRIDSPEDDFDLDILLMKEGTIIYSKNARLKSGINNISLILDNEIELGKCLMQIRSKGQSIERKFEELEA
jgi:hypothetical protein